jgi:hypothetical protein
LLPGSSSLYPTNSLHKNYIFFIYFFYYHFPVWGRVSSSLRPLAFCICVFRMVLTVNTINCLGSVSCELRTESLDLDKLPKNTSPLIPASRKRRRKGNPVVSGETVPADLREG